MLPGGWYYTYMPIASKENDEQIQERLLRAFWENGRTIREDRGISQSELARRIGRSAGYVCDIEHGRRSPNLTTVALFAEALGCTSSSLVSLSLAAGKIQPSSAE